MKENEPHTEHFKQDESTPTRREFLTFLGAVGGAASLAGAAAESLYGSSASQPPTYPEMAVDFAGAPSPQFFMSGETLQSAGYPGGYYSPETAGAAPQESWPQSVPALTTPNMLIIMVDEIWNGLWLPNDANGHPTTAPIDAYCPNLQSLRDNSIRFLSYYAAACNCTPSRAVIETGLYARQTNVYNTQVSAATPSLNTNFSTFGDALQDNIFGSPPTSASPYLGNVKYVGKWHLSNQTGNMGSGALTPYGFSYVPSPPLGRNGPSPNGIPNEGQQPANHGPAVGPGANPSVYFASDPDITGAALQALSALTSQSNPWCLVVSYVDPHDIAFYPAYFSTPSNGYPTWGTTGFAPGSPYFAPNGSDNSLSPEPYAAVPSPWNYESSLTSKPSLQTTFQGNINAEDLAVTNWADFLNNYIWVQSLVDTEIGKLFGAGSSTAGLRNLPLAVQQQTIVIFTTDHGDYAGSHGLHAKGGAAYEEAINIPLYVQLPMNTNPVQYYQATTNYMCSAVDFFPMIVEFATGNLGWRGKPRYSDLANRQSIVYKIYHPASSESRTVSIGTGTQTAAVPYILFTTDEALSSETSNSAAYPINPTQLQNHVTCVRTKTGKSLTPYGQIVQGPLQYSGKFVAYDYWPACTTAPGTQPTQYEFYDYTNLDSAIGVVNFGEIGNQTPVAFGGPNAPSYCPVSGATASQQLFCQLVAAAYSSPGVFSTELAAPLTGKAADGTTNLSSVAAAQEAQYFNYLTSVYGVGPCSS